VKVFILNCGSSSVKYQLLDMDTEKVLAKGGVERVGIDGTFLVHKRPGSDDYRIELGKADHKDSIGQIIGVLVDPTHGVLKSASEIDAVGHRVVHGGEKFSGSVVITDDVKAALTECIDLAPLHNPPNLQGIAAAEELLPGVPQVGVFDTAFHATLPEKAYLYGIPYGYYRKYKVRRYGFHGTSHRFVSERAAQVLNRPYGQLKTIVCHLGNGASISAVLNGKSVDTSMGLTPLEGVIMGTRSGDLDPAIIEFIGNKEGLDSAGMISVLNKKSGILGLSEISSDMRDVEDAYFKGDERAVRTIEAYAYRVAKYVGAYTAAMNGVDCIVFTAGVGENAPLIREKVCGYLTYLGVELDEAANEKRGEHEISTAASKVRVWVIPTNEELAIARDTKALAGK
jgi:acetate kinase